MARVLFVLQNPWRRGKVARRWDGYGWERALWNSQTGKRLCEYIPRGVEFKVINANPVAAGDIRTVRGPNCRYVQKQVHVFEPTLIVLLGRVAARLNGYLDTPVPVLCFPHPCYRLLSKVQTANYRRIIQEWCLER